MIRFDVLPNFLRQFSPHSQHLLLMGYNSSTQAVYFNGVWKLQTCHFFSRDNPTYKKSVLAYTVCFALKSYILILQGSDLTPKLWSLTRLQTKRGAHLQEKGEKLFRQQFMTAAGYCMWFCKECNQRTNWASVALTILQPLKEINFHTVEPTSYTFTKLHTEYIMTLLFSFPLCHVNKWPLLGTQPVLSQGFCGKFCQNPVVSPEDTLPHV